MLWALFDALMRLYIWQIRFVVSVLRSTFLSLESWKWSIPFTSLLSLPSSWWLVANWQATGPLQWSFKENGMWSGLSVCCGFSVLLFFTLFSQFNTRVTHHHFQRRQEKKRKKKGTISISGRDSGPKCDSQKLLKLLKARTAEDARN